MIYLHTYLNCSVPNQIRYSLAAEVIFMNLYFTYEGVLLRGLEQHIILTLLDQ